MAETLSAKRKGKRVKTERTGVPSFSNKKLEDLFQFFYNVKLEGRAKRTLEKYELIKGRKDLKVGESSSIYSWKD